MTGVYCFDSFVKEVRAKGIKVNLQYHDEILVEIFSINTERLRLALQEAIEKVNSNLKLNVPLGISSYFADTYADCH